MLLHDDYQDALLQELQQPRMKTPAPSMSDPGPRLGPMSEGSVPGFDVGEPRPGSIPDLPSQASPVAQQATSGAPKPDYSGWGQYGIEGIDAGKVASGHASPKYQIARIQSHFDPTQGVTPDMLSALNSLGIGDFSGGKDWIYVNNGVDKFDGVKGADIIRNEGPQGAWQGWGGDYGIPGGSYSGGAGSAGQSGMAPGLSSLLTGNPLGLIQNAIAQQAGQGEYLQAILQQLGMQNG